MPNLSLFEPDVLTGVVDKIPAPETLTFVNSLPKNSTPFPNYSWDVLRGSRHMSKPNVPNAEAHIVPREGRSRETAALVYVRDKKVLEPTTLYWLRAQGSSANVERAEAAILRELKDLNLRIDNLVEWSCWQALVNGSLNFKTEDVVADVDYKFASSHKPVASTNWATATPQQIIADVTAWKQLIVRDGKVAPKVAYASSTTISKIVSSFAAGSASLLSDRAKDAYYSTGSLPGFLGLEWEAVDSVYDADNGDQVGFLPDNKVVIANLTDNRPMEIVEGPTADLSNGQQKIGRFSKSWVEEDPSARQILVEYNFLPVINRPDSIVSATIG